VKASAGGGGKGMRVARTPEECREAFALARSEATAAFGDGRVFVERFVERPRHVEVQVLGDAHGTMVHLGERECSIQRRHQKVVEEAPSPSVDEEARERMGAAAIALAKAVGYRSAGTVELVVDERGGFFFLEMNTRLQVEHPVTELVTGIDIVEQQLRIAAGEPLSFSQADVTLTGSAIECRIYAEDAEAGFVPATGTLGRLRLPAGEGVRVDHGLREGEPVTAAYDPMLAKVAAWAPTRTAAIDRLRAALRATVVFGTVTNTAYLERVVGHPAFAAGETYTSFLDEHAADLASPPPDPDTEQLVLVAAALASPRFDPIHGLGTMHGTMGAWGRRTTPERARPTPLELHVDDGPVRPVTATRTGVAARMEIDGRPVAASLRPHGDGHVATAGPLREHVDVHVEQDVVHVHLRGRGFRVGFVDPDQAMLAGSDHDDVVTAPMPGTVITVPVAAGDAVVAGQAVVVIESMKMQSELVAMRDGVVARVHQAVGDTFDRGMALVTLEAATDADGVAA
jgi:acetyl/propionyl-CoA carboxylase alpha subunit